MIVYALIVTYGDRFDLCEKVIDECLSQNLDKVFVVNNGSSDESHSKLQVKSLENSKLNIISSTINLGSAGGYKAGLKFILEEGVADYLWMLDDDTVPNRGAYQAIKYANTLLKLNNDDEYVLYSYRGNHWEQDISAVKDGTVKKYLANNFCGFNLFSKLRECLARKSKNKKVNYPIIRTTFGPYGGMFIPAKIISKIGYPDADFFCYADDHDFSLRLNELDVNQYLIHASELIDIDKSFAKNNSYFDSDLNEAKLFYTIRNHVFLSQKFIKNKQVYKFNKIIYQLIIFKEALKSFLLYFNFALIRKRLRIVYLAISRGEKGFLGVVDSQDLS